MYGATKTDGEATSVLYICMYLIYKLCVVTSATIKSRSVYGAAYAVRDNTLEERKKLQGSTY